MNNTEKEKRRNVPKNDNLFCRRLKNCGNYIRKFYYLKNIINSGRSKRADQFTSFSFFFFSNITFFIQQKRTLSDFLNKLVMITLKFQEGSHLGNMRHLKFKEC